jgi:hypothetical protein
MAHTKRTRKSPASPAARRTAAPESTAPAVGRGTTIALFATLALSLATAIASAVWLISTNEYTGMTATTMPNAQATAANATPAAPTAPMTATASASLTDAATPSGTQATTKQPAAPPAPSVPSGAGQRAFIDPVTGELRQPEHEELTAIAAAEAAAAPARRLARTANAAPQFFGADGSVSAVVPEDLHTFTVATRGPDGRIVIEHAQGPSSAARLVKANSAKKSPQASLSRAQQKEDRHDR